VYFDFRKIDQKNNDADTANDDDMMLMTGIITTTGISSWTRQRHEIIFVIERQIP
jgi:hypothetical protein